MYFPVGWPKGINLPLNDTSEIRQICCDGVKILIGAISDSAIGIWYTKPLIPITYHKRSDESVKKYGKNSQLIWKPDSSKLAVITDKGCIIFYKVDVDLDATGILNQIDSPCANLKRDSAELFIKEIIPRLFIKEMCNVSMDSIITSLSCISLSEIMIATQNCELIRLQWDELEYNSNVIDLRKITFYANQNSNNPKGVPLIGTKSYVRTMDYSPLIGGFAVVFNDYKAAFLTANSLKFEQNKVQGFWVPDLEDATCCSINHKYRLMAFGRKNSEAAIFAIEDTTGGLEFSHKLSLNCKIYPNSLGAVNELKWSPDGCAIAMAWKNGGISLWSTFGTMLMSSLSWDFGLHVDLPRNNPLVIYKMEWSTEGYQLFMLRKSRHDEDSINDQPVQNTNVLQMDFVKSTLTMNPCMTAHSHILLQGDNTIYLNQGNNLETVYCGSKCTFPNNQNEPKHSIEENFEIGKFTDISSILSESKYWTIVQLPLTYAATNWPIRYSAIDSKGIHIAVAGRTGLAHYSVLTKKWKLFGNETQEKDFVVTGGLLWWKDFIIMGCFSLLDRSDEIRSYPKESKLDNQFVSKMQVKAPVMLLNIYLNQLVALQADGMVNIFNLHRNNNSNILGMECMYEIDIRSICIHPACIVSLTVTNLKNDLGVKFAGHDSNVETIVLNVSGRILMVQRESKTNVIIPSMATCLASCVECFWQSNSENSHMKDCLWLYSGAHGMRVWLPILPPEEEIQNRHRRHTFMSKRIMLSFPLKLYPLVILFENVIFLGVENESTLYTSDFSSHFSLPFSFLEKKSQVYLHKILRQLIKRNLGYSAWEIAKSCRNLPYFPHSLELLLHEVLEEEATSKDPIPDALLPSILDFIREFPVYLQTIVQCARKTEIALWPYLFSIAGKPKELFQQCLEIEELETAASYLIILQNLEPSSISKQYATLLLDIALENKKWELAKDLIRFLKAIDPNEVDSPRSSFIVNNKIAPTPQPQVNSDPDVLNLILGPIARERSFSTPMAINMSKTNANISVSKSKDNKNFNSTKEENAANLQRRKSERSISREKKEIFFIETILQRHARKLLENNKLLDLGYMSAFLDIQLVSWISQENERAGKINDFVTTLIQVHEEFNLPTPILQTESDELSNNTLSYLNDHCRNTSSHTSESGYFSLPIGDKSDGVNNFGQTYSNSITCIKEDDEQSVVNFERFNSLPEGSSHYENRIAATFYNQGQQSEFLKKNLPEKLEVKIRYLLQLLIEANCIDYSLILSIILLDASSIVRIINFALRSDSISSCYRIQTALKKITHWSFQEKTNYRNFMMLLQPQLYILDQYIAQHNLNYVKENIMDNTELEMHSEKNSIPVSSTNLPKTSNNWSDIQNNSKALRKKSNSLDAVTQTRLIDNNSENEHIKNENGICIVM